MPAEQVTIFKTDSDDGYPHGKYTWKGVARISNNRLQSSLQNEEIKIVYDDNTKTVVVLDMTPHFPDVISESHKYFPSDATLMIPCGLRAEDMDSVNVMQSLGFDLSISSAHPLGLKFDGARLWGTRQNNLRQDTGCKEWLTETDYYCEARVRLTEDTVKKLWKLVSEPIEVDGKEEGDVVSEPIEVDGKEEGDVVSESMPVEVAGRLDANESSEGHYDLTLNEGSVKPGDHTEVAVAEGVYNFHTHPTGIYKLYGLSIGIPSNQDYVGYLAAVHEYNTAMHLVLAKEGIYYISLAPGFIPFIGVMDDDFADRILEEFPGCLKQDGYTGKQIHSKIQSYIKKINSFECLGIKVFTLTFKPWTFATAERVVFVPKPPSGECIFTQEELIAHRKLFGTDLTELFGDEDKEGRTEILSGLKDRKKMLEYHSRNVKV